MSSPADRSILVENLTRCYGDLRAVDSVDLQIDSGRVFGFLGPNGAGKTTLVKVLTTMLAPTTGRALVGGHDVVSEGHQVRSLIGVALQEVGLDPLMTASELLQLQARLFGYTPEAARDRGRLLLERVGLDDVPSGKRVGAYSGGMKRRLDLALALVHEPAILFLDEPTTGLDPVSRVDIWTEVRRLNRDQGVTIFLTTQYLEEADRLADEVAIISRGHIVAQGSPEELKREVGQEVISLVFADDEDARRAEDVLGHLDGSRQLAGRELLVYSAKAAELVPSLVRRLDAHGLVLKGLSLAQPSLDDVFLRATGERMEEGDESHLAEKVEP